MDYAAEREYNRAEKVAVVMELLHKAEREVTIHDVAQEAGCSVRTAYRLMIAIERAVASVRKEGAVWSYTRRG